MASVWPLYHKDLIGGVLQKSFSHLHRGILELCQWPSGYWFDRAASSRKILGGSKLLPFKNDGGHCVLGDLQCCINVFVPFPRFVPRHNPVSELYGQFVQPHGLGFALTCTVNCGTLYRQGCAFPNHVQSIELTTGGLQSSCKNIPRYDQWKQETGSSVSILIAKGRNTYVN